MSAIDTNRVIGGARPFGFASKLVETFRSWNDTRMTRNELSNLSDRELDDIGLARGDIERIARGL